MKAGRVIAITLFLAGVTAGSTLAAPIRTNTPGTGVFQRSGLLVGVVADGKEGGGTELRTLSSFVDLRYTPDTHWVFGARVPVVVENRVERPGVGAESATSGLGDIVVSAKHRFYRRVGRWADRQAAVEVGLKLPTGTTDHPVDPALGAALRSRLQPGTGSTDGFLDLSYQQGRRRWVFAGDVGYRFNSEGDGDYRQGDEAQLNLSAQYILFPRVYTRPGKEVFAVLEGSFVDAGEDRLDGTILSGTGRTALFLAPGLQYVATERLFLDLSVQFPVWEEVGRGGLTSRWSALAQIRFAF